MKIIANILLFIGKFINAIGMIGFCLLVLAVATVVPLNLAEAVGDNPLVYLGISYLITLAVLMATIT